jgi:Serine/threonine protein kinase
MNYEIGSEIGRGGFGIVFKGIEKLSGKCVILKRIIKKSSELLFLKESQNVKNVVNLLDFFELDNWFYIVMEYIENCIDLFDLIDHHFPLKELVIRNIFKEIVDCTVELSKLNIYHSDIKVDNVIIGYETPNFDNGTIPKLVKLIDFGNARFGNKLNDFPFQPTLFFSSPEYVNEGKILIKEFTVWTLGCLLYILLTGNDPFATGNKLEWPNSFIPVDLKELTEECLEKDSSKRKILEEITSDGFVNTYQR